MIARRIIRRNGRRGVVGVVILLIVIAVIFILLLNGELSRDNPGGVTTAIKQIDDAGSAACGINRNAVATNLVMWDANHGGEKATIQQLRDMVGGQTCPRGGVYLLGKDGKIYCTVHHPLPPAEMKEALALTLAQPVLTPVSSNTLPPDMMTTQTLATPTPKTTPSAAPPAK